MATEDEDKREDAPAKPTSSKAVFQFDVPLRERTNGSLLKDWIVVILGVRNLPKEEGNDVKRVPLYRMSFCLYVKVV